MHTVLLQQNLHPRDLNQLINEFPQYNFVSSENFNLETAIQGNTVMQDFNSESLVMVGDHSQMVKAPTITSDYGLKDCVNLSPSTAVSRFNAANSDKKNWEDLEIIYGNEITKKQLADASSLRWIHSPTLDIQSLCYSDVWKRENIIISTAGEENSQQISEFVIGAVLGFSKHLFNWVGAMRFPNTLWDNKWRDTMWTLQNRTFLQIGLAKTASSIVQRAQQMHMQVWGVQQQKSFHPYCHKTFSMNDLKTVIPSADIICICLPDDPMQTDLFKTDELELMKEDSILIVIGNPAIVNGNDLTKVAKSGKFRGILFDSPIPIPIKSDLWNIPDIIITPDIASRPQSLSREAFQVFHYNLRHFQRGDLSNMRNLVNLRSYCEHCCEP